MNLHPLGNTGIQVSTIIYGGIVSTMGHYANYTYTGDGQRTSDQYVELALNAGINYFDVAPKYGDAQEMLGNSLRGVRDKITLACKTAMRDYDSAARDLERSLKLLHTDHFDVYQIHALCNEDDVRRVFAPNGAMKLLEEMKRSGTALHLGITSHSEGAALMALDQYEFETLMFPINWHMHMAIGFGDRVLRKARQRGMGILGMKAMIERGFRDGDDALRLRWPKSWCKPFDPVEQADLLLAAMKYSWSLGMDTFIPAGDIEHFQFALDHVNELSDLTEEDVDLLKRHLPGIGDDLFMPEEDR